MRKTSSKLQLKTTTLKALQNPQLAQVAGGAYSRSQTQCSDSCSTCNSCSDAEDTLCVCLSVAGFC
jgi:hypothetical protein